LPLLLGAALSGGVAWLVGRPILRLKGYYLAVASLGFGILVSMVLSNEAKLTGGPDGMAVAGTRPAQLKLASIGIGLSNAQFWYAFSGFVHAHRRLAGAQPA
jgi:branched-chain amino acid transport system permease protein